VLLSGNANPLIETPTGATAFSLAGGRKRVAATIAEACVLFSIEYNNIPSMLTAISNGWLYMLLQSMWNISIRVE